jgi:hypothetical protein
MLLRADIGLHVAHVHIALTGDITVRTIQFGCDLSSGPLDSGIGSSLSFGNSVANERY